jgi:hypothetical protein
MKRNNRTDKSKSRLVLDEQKIRELAPAEIARSVGGIVSGLIDGDLKQVNC